MGETEGHEKGALAQNDRGGETPVKNEYRMMRET